MNTLHPAEKKGKIFLNPIPTTLGAPGSLKKILKLYMTNKAEVVPKKQLPEFKTDTSIFNSPPASGLRITWIGHSSLLIEIDGVKLLTDPVFSARASFLSFIGPKRFFPPPLSLDQLPKLDAIIISHDHYDHLDEATINKLGHTTTPIYCSLGIGKLLEKWGISKSRITEMDWCDIKNITPHCTITATPARHFSGRGIVNRNRTLWSSFVIKTKQHNIFYGADSGWYSGFKDIGDAFGPFDLTMLEIGAYNENWPDIHMGPEKATDAHIALRGKVMLPIHWGTFNLALHAWKEPVERVLSFAKEKNIILLLPKPGEPVEVLKSPYVSYWWNS
jgi:L-ascorbate metabolism protein UlaG (beta-lactamase superfamily)